MRRPQTRWSIRTRRRAYSLAACGRLDVEERLVEISFAAGPAASAPNPPCAMSTTTTTFGLFAGAHDAYHEWSLARRRFRGAGLAGDRHGEVREERRRRARRRVRRLVEAVADRPLVDELQLPDRRELQQSAPTRRAGSRSRRAAARRCRRSRAPSTRRRAAAASPGGSPGRSTRLIVCPSYHGWL